MENAILNPPPSTCLHYALRREQSSIIDPRPFVIEEGYSQSSILD